MSRLVPHRAVHYTRDLDYYHPPLLEREFLEGRDMFMRSEPKNIPSQLCIPSFQYWIIQFIHVICFHCISGFEKYKDRWHWDQGFEVVGSQLGSSTHLFDLLGWSTQYSLSREAPSCWIMTSFPGRFIFTSRRPASWKTDISQHFSCNHVYRSHLPHGRCFSSSRPSPRRLGYEIFPSKPCFGEGWATVARILVLP
jgi:hypothetical protein